MEATALPSASNRTRQYESPVVGPDLSRDRHGRFLGERLEQLPGGLLDELFH